MTIIPNATRQQTRLITIPQFKEVVAPPEELGGRTIPIEPGAELGTEYSPTVGYGLELTAIQMPISFIIATEGTEEERKAASFTSLATLALYRRGQLLWEGAASLLSAFQAENLNPFKFRAVWGTFQGTFTNPFIVPAPSELTISGRIIVSAINATTGHSVKWQLTLINASFGFLKNFAEPGSIAYNLVKMPYV